MSALTLIRLHPLKFIVSILVSGLFVYLAFRGLEWRTFWDSIISIEWWWILAGAVILVLSNVLRAARWGILLSPQKKISVHELFQVVMIGYLGNNVLPFKMGELLRAVVAGRRYRLPVSGTGASIVVERGIDMFSFLVFAGLYGALVPTLDTARLLSILGLIAIVVLVVLTAWMNRRHDRFFRRLETWAQQREATGHQRLAKQVLSLFRGLETIWRMPHPVSVIMLTVGLWVVYFLVTLATMLAFRMGLSPLEYMDASMILLIFTTLSLAIPAAPGYVGTYHGAAIAALVIFGVNQDQARAFAVVIHLMNYLLYTPIGGYYLVKLGMNLNLVEEAEQAETPGTGKSGSH